MDSFMNIAKQGLNAYNDSHDKANKTGGPELNSPDNGRSDSPAIDQQQAIKTAEHSGSGDSSLFATALNFLSENKVLAANLQSSIMGLVDGFSNTRLNVQSSQKEPLDEEDVTKAHDKVYNQGTTSGLSANLLGSAAAMQVLKQFTSGSGSTGASSGGNFQTKLISLAMAEATKLFDKSSGASGDKQDAVNGAAMTVMKLLVQSKLGGAPTTGGSDSGGLGGLLSLVSQLVTVTRLMYTGCC
ncbi:hypothetical protein FA15DRAFT_37027 [Coprinopsis marcescibilis]|uniref:DUF7721 domain-containing protein n=1 Tax=Coprinopsis marcescibilis TaxID=230819 RepID=A0A5C3LDN0_COPMA|nr:hypothetical protein FA15DRAFT_37027 [Coprinopsis marcescibilis]